MCENIFWKGNEEEQLLLKGEEIMWELVNILAQETFITPDEKARLYILLKEEYRI